MSLAKLTILTLFCTCTSVSRSDRPGPLPDGQLGHVALSLAETNPYPTISAIPAPAGYHRFSDGGPGRGDGAGSFPHWLRQRSLKKDRTVHLYNGQPKGNQDAQFAVLDISVGREDLQQCADAVMRLRAEYLFSQRAYRAISFITRQNVALNYAEWAGGLRWRLSGGKLTPVHTGPVSCEDRACFDGYLRTVFMYCGTASLERQLRPVPRVADIMPGDVFIRGGAPGHAMIVMDVAFDDAGHRAYLLAQSYMPAQEMHIVRNPSSKDIDPWYIAEGQSPIFTPEWTFQPAQLRSWP